MFHVHLQKYILLLLGRVFYKYRLGQVGQISLLLSLPIYCVHVPSIVERKIEMSYIVLEGSVSPLSSNSFTLCILNSCYWGQKISYCCWETSDHGLLAFFVHFLNRGEVLIIYCVFVALVFFFFLFSIFF